MALICQGRMMRNKLKGSIMKWSWFVKIEWWEICWFFLLRDGMICQSRMMRNQLKVFGGRWSLFVKTSWMFQLWDCPDLSRSYDKKQVESMRCEMVMIYQGRMMRNKLSVLSARWSWFFKTSWMFQLWEAHDLSRSNHKKQVEMFWCELVLI